MRNTSFLSTIFRGGRKAMTRPVTLLPLNTSRFQRLLFPRPLVFVAETPKLKCENVCEETVGTAVIGRPRPHPSATDNAKNKNLGDG